MAPKGTHVLVARGCRRTALAPKGTALLAAARGAGDTTISAPEGSVIMVAGPAAPLSWRMRAALCWLPERVGAAWPSRPQGGTCVRAAPLATRPAGRGARIRALVARMRAGGRTDMAQTGTGIMAARAGNRKAVAPKGTIFMVAGKGGRHTTPLAAMQQKSSGGAPATGGPWPRCGTIAMVADGVAGGTALRAAMRQPNHGRPPGSRPQLALSRALSMAAEERGRGTRCWATRWHTGIGRARSDTTASAPKGRPTLVAAWEGGAGDTALLAPKDTPILVAGRRSRAGVAPKGTVSMVAGRSDTEALASKGTLTLVAA